MLPQVSLRYSRTGIVQKALGSFKLENVCLALAGSLEKKNMNLKIAWIDKWLTDLENLMHKLKLFPVPFAKIEVGIAFSF